MKVKTLTYIVWFKDSKRTEHDDITLHDQPELEHGHTHSDNQRPIFVCSLHPINCLKLCKEGFEARKNCGVK